MDGPLGQGRIRGEASAVSWFATRKDVTWFAISFYRGLKLKSWQPLTDMLIAPLKADGCIAKAPRSSSAAGDDLGWQLTAAGRCRKAEESSGFGSLLAVQGLVHLSESSGADGALLIARLIVVLSGRTSAAGQASTILIGHATSPPLRGPRLKRPA